MWAAWQLSVPAMGWTCLDHCQPGSKVARPTGPLSRLTSSSLPESCSKGRTSSGLSRLFWMRPAIGSPLLAGLVGGVLRRSATGGDEHFARPDEAVGSLESAELVGDLGPGGLPFGVVQSGEHLVQRPERFTLESQAFGRRVQPQGRCDGAHVDVG